MIRSLLKLVLLWAVLFWAPAGVGAQSLTLNDAIEMAQAHNRAIRSAELEKSKTLDRHYVARAQRLPVFSMLAINSEPLTHFGLTLSKGSLGVYPNVGPIPGRTTTLESPLRPAAILFAYAAQPLSQQHKIGLGIQLARIGSESAEEQIRLKRRATTNDVRRIYYTMLQTESGVSSLRATVGFLQRLVDETSKDVEQRVALTLDLLDVKAQLAEANYELLELDHAFQNQKEQLNVLLGRPPDTPFDLDTSSIAKFELPDLQAARAIALESRAEVRLAKLRVRQTELERRIKNAERIPDVSIIATTLTTGNLSNALPRSLSGIGLQVNWDVFDWGRKRKEVQERRKSEEQAALDLQDAQASVLVDVNQRYRRVVETRQQVEVAQTAQAAAAELLRVMRNRYTQREALLSDLLKAQSGMANADHRFTQALSDLAIAQADFEKAIGQDQ